ncbi:MAG: TolC family protein [Geobacteraceae bacterium]|nr:TolC family protein [Geobacteraceae bacterium]
MNVKKNNWIPGTSSIAGTFPVLVTLLVLLFLPANLPAEEVKPVESLSALVTTALENNPDVKASEARWQVFSNRIAQARSFEDPMLMLKIQNGVIRYPLDFSKEPMTSKVIGITQQLPFWGKRALKGEIAEKEAESYKWEVEERKLQLTRMVKETYYQLYYIDRSLGIVDRNIRILDDFITLAETKYSVNKGLQQDVFTAQVERSKMLDLQISLEQQRKSGEANLNALLSRPALTPVGSIADVKMQPLTLNPEQLEAIADDKRPLLKSARASIEKAGAGLTLAKKEYFPDFNVSLEYMQREPVNGSDGFDMYTLGLTFNLPVQTSRRQAAVAESNADITTATEELNSIKNTIQAGIADLVAQMERRRKLAELYKTGILPQARQSLGSSVIGYRVSKVDFLTMLDSMITLFTYEREYYDSVADYQAKRAQLEALVGQDLP